MPRNWKTATGLAGLVLAASMFSVPALADAIDGNWCHNGGKRLSINGPAITTPGGNKITGDYDRHGFRYVVPAGEPAAGGTVDMVLIDDDTVQVKPPGDAKLEQWKRCAAATS